MIDECLPGEWPTEVLSALRTFRQGDVVERPPFFYAMSPLHPVCATKLIDPHEGMTTGDYDLVEYPDERRPPFGMITTQTCDIQEQGRPAQPWVSIAPVYNAMRLTPDQQRAVKRHEKGYLIHLTGPAFIDGFFVADLRIELPVEKGWLVGKAPLDGFVDDDGRIACANRLALRLGRPALANEVVEHVTGPLRGWLRGMGAQARAETHEPVAEIGVEVFGSHDRPDAVKLVVLARTDPLSEEARDRWSSWAVTTQAALPDDVTPTFLGVEVTTLSDVTAARYRKLVILDFRFLSPEGWADLVA